MDNWLVVYGLLVDCFIVCFVTRLAAPTNKLYRRTKLTGWLAYYWIVSFS